MPKKLTVVAIGLTSAIVLSFGYLLLSKDAPKSVDTRGNSTERRETSTTPADSTTSEQQQTVAAGTYQDYTAERVSAARGTNILFFHAPWCPQCRRLDQSISAGRIPDGVNIFKVDFDSNTALRQKYGVTIQTTLVKIDQNGDEQKKIVPYDQPTLDTLITELL